MDSHKRSEILRRSRWIRRKAPGDLRRNREPLALAYREDRFACAGAPALARYVCRHATVHPPCICSTVIPPPVDVVFCQDSRLRRVSIVSSRPILVVRMFVLARRGCGWRLSILHLPYSLTRPSLDKSDHTIRARLCWWLLRDRTKSLHTDNICFFGVGPCSLAPKVQLTVPTRHYQRQPAHPFFDPLSADSIMYPPTQ